MKLAFVNCELVTSKKQEEQFRLRMMSYVGRTVKRLSSSIGEGEVIERDLHWFVSGNNNQCVQKDGRYVMEENHAHVVNRSGPLH